MEINTKIILISYIATVMLMKGGFTVMAAFLCILVGLANDDGVASFRAHLGGIETAKTLCTDGIARLSVPATGLTSTAKKRRNVVL